MFVWPKEKAKLLLTERVYPLVLVPVGSNPYPAPTREICTRPGPYSRVRVYPQAFSLSTNCTGWMCQIGSSLKLGLMTYCCLHGQAPRYLAEHITPTIEVAFRHRLRSANRHRFIVSRCRLSTYSRRAFPVAGPTV